MNNEWELLMIADDIEPGDTIVVEDSETGESHEMIYVKQPDRKTVALRGQDGATKRFSASSLEELDGECVIVGKS